MDWETRFAAQADVPALVALAAAFVAESALPYQFDPDAAARSFRLYMHEATTAVIVVEGPAAIAGFAIVGFDTDFTVDPVGYLMKFYVAPGARGTGAARVLVRSATDWFDQRGCVDTWATATGGIGQDTAFVNLMAKVGFVPAGPTLRRVSLG